jgi:Secretion system C-terminal sorting domain
LINITIMKRSVGLGLVLIVLTMNVAAQVVTPPQQLMIKPKGQIVCYASGESHSVYLPPPSSFTSSARTETSDIRVTYVGFPADGLAQAAFQRAVDIWASIIQSPVRINIRAAWVSQGATTLGSAIWGNAYANFDGAPKLGVFYPVALAEKLAGRPLNPDPNPATGDNFDIYAFFNSDQTRWSFLDDATSNQNRYNLTTVVLHEIGHGLGFTDSYSLANGVGAFGLQGGNVPIIFDVGVENGVNNTRLLNQANNTATMASLLTNNNINYNPTLSIGTPPTIKPKLYAPSPWQDGSSIAHLDQTTYAGTADRLMRPQLDLGQVTLNPGNIVLNMFSDMGWVAPRMVHTPLEDTETTNAPFAVTATVTNDGTSGYTIDNTVKIRYSVNGGTEVEANMTAGSSNQYTFQLPAPSVVPTTYNYYIIATDSYNGQNRTFAKPGQIIRPGQSDQQVSYQFLAGPDLIPPVITSTPIDFIFSSVTSINVKATVTDNIGVQSVSLDYQRNNGLFTTLALTQDNDTLSLYKAIIPTAGVVIGDAINYRIKATDISANTNVANAPATGLYSVAVTGILPSQASYQNNFDAPTNDFFGNGYSIGTPVGFSNAAIHSAHPYSDGTGPNNESNYVYQLRVPIKIDGSNPKIKFDEIVLVEPSQNASTPFGDPNFWDYVVVDGSADNGVTWKRFLDGYDSRANADWLTRWTSSIVADNSTASGDPALYRTRTIDMTANGNFKANDIVLIRFRLFADQAAHGWGWAIDNLKIQIDDTPPVVLHNHLDFSNGNSSPLKMNINATDASGLKTLEIEFKVNGGSVTSVPVSVQSGVANYNLDVVINTIPVGAVLEYRIKSSDNLDNTGFLPSTGFFKVPIISTGTPVTQYFSDFNSTNTDFVGNFFSVSTATGFNDGAINSLHPYQNGFGLNNSSSYSYMLTKPITVSGANPNIYFTEALVAEYSGINVKDFAVIEGSKDNGATWQAISESYSSNAFPDWRQSFDAKGTANSSLFKVRLLDITKNGNFKAGDVILIRFRLFADAINNGWGWAIDNLNIQTPITGFERSVLETSFSIYPNPSNGSKMNVQLETPSDNPVKVQILTANGGTQQEVSLRPIENKIEHEFFVGDWADGFYIVKAEVNGAVVTRKFIKSR